MSKVCDSCRGHCALVYCSADMAYLCIECDLKVHRANKVASRHDRVWVCEVCEHAPAAVICKADAAALCHACDRDIHSANPLASRHERVPVVPFFECPGMVKVAHVNASVHSFAHLEEGFLHNKDLELPGGMKIKSAAENFIDFSQGFEEAPISLSVPEVLRHYASLTSSKNDHGSPNSLGSLGSLSHNSMSSSPLLGVVPDTSLNDISKPCYYERTDYISQLEPIAREARVLRYKEKRKNRKFEKTVRYASRKAYAEIRPRVKGRFVKRSDVDEGIVPSI